MPQFLVPEGKAVERGQGPVDAPEKPFSGIFGPEQGGGVRFGGGNGPHFFRGIQDVVPQLKGQSEIPAVILHGRDPAGIRPRQFGPGQDGGARIRAPVFLRKSS